MKESTPPGTHAVTCPHCKKPFEAALIADAAGRRSGFKCPHCRLFVPTERAETQSS